MKLAALLLAIGTTIVAASVLIPTEMKQDEIQRVPLVPLGSSPATPADHVIAPPEQNVGSTESGTDSSVTRRRGSPIVDVEPQGDTGSAEGQHANGSNQDTDQESDPDDDCHHDDEDFPWCDEDPPSER